MPDFIDLDLSPPALVALSCLREDGSTDAQIFDRALVDFARRNNFGHRLYPKATQSPAAASGTPRPAPAWPRHPAIIDGVQASPGGDWIRLNFRRPGQKPDGHRLDLDPRRNMLAQLAAFVSIDGIDGLPTLMGRRIGIRLGGRGTITGLELRPFPDILNDLQHLREEVPDLMTDAKWEELLNEYR